MRSRALSAIQLTHIHRHTHIHTNTHTLTHTYIHTHTHTHAEGYVRSRPLSANQLVHITGVGTYQMHCLSLALDPCPLKPSRDDGMARVGTALGVSMGVGAEVMDDGGGNGGGRESTGVEGVGGRGGMCAGVVEVCGGGAILGIRNESAAHGIESQVRREKEHSCRCLCLCLCLCLCKGCGVGECKCKKVWCSIQN